MVTTAEALGHTHIQYSVKLYIRNTSSTYVDFTDRFGEDRLRNIAEIVMKADNEFGQPVTQSVTIKADNSDRYWDEDAPAAFDGWEGRYVQVRVDVAGATESNIATYRIAPDGIETDLTATATIRLEPLTEALRRVPAESIRQGQDWYQGRPWTFLCEEQMRGEYGDASGDLPSGYEIPADPRITFADGSKHLSIWGKPPQWDGSTWNTDNTDIPRAIEYDDTNDLIYVGIAEKLWRLDPSTGTWEDLGEDATIGTGDTVRALFMCGAGVVVCKWEDDYTTATGTDLHITFYDTTADGWDTTTRGTQTGFFSGQWLIYNGAYDSGWSSGYQVRGRINTHNYSGTHVPVPFRQYITHNHGTGTDNAEVAGDGDGIEPLTITQDLDPNPYTGWVDLGADSPPPYGKMVNNGYHAFRGASAVSDSLELRVNFSQKPNLVWDRVDGTPDGYLYVVREVTGTQNIYQLSITQGGSISSTTVLSTGYSTANIHSMAMGANGNYLNYVVFAEKVDSTGYDGTSMASVYIASGLPNAATGGIANTNLADNTDMIIDMIYADWVGGDYLFTKFKAANCYTFPRWQLSYYDTGTATETVLDSSTSYFVVPRLHHNAFPLVYIDTGTGAVKKLTGWTSGPTVIDSGRPPVFDAPFCFDFRYTTGSDPEIYGLSAPFHAPETQETVTEGKHYLWQHTTKHTGRVELADFDGLDKLEALQALCTAFRHRVFVDADGNFRIRERAPATAATRTIGPDLFDRGWNSIKKMAPTRIINYAEMHPYEATLGKMETTLVQKDSSPFDGSVEATQLDTRSRRVRMRCILGGLISGGNTRWDVMTFKESIQTRLGAAYTSGTSVTLDSVYDVEVGDDLEVSDSGVREITSVTPSTKVVTIASGFSSAYAILSPALITKKNDQKWSGSGIATLTESGGITAGTTTFEISSVVDVAVGNYLSINGEEMLVDGVDRSTNDVTVTRGASAAAAAEGDTVAMIVKPAGLNKWTLVGNQKISVRFDQETGANGDSTTAVTEGTYIEFICPGLSLEQVKQSRIVKTNGASITKHREQKPRQAVDNRFLNRLLGEFYIGDLVDRNATKKRRFAVTMGLDLQHKISDTFTLKSADMLPDETSNELDVIVEEVRHKLFDAGRQTTYVVEEQ